MSLYAEWCTAISHERAVLESARDARSGNLNNPAVTQRFSDALAAFDRALAEHINETDCQLRH